MEIEDYTKHINEKFLEYLDDGLRKHGLLTRTQILTGFVSSLIKHLKSGTKKKEFFDCQIKLINQQCLENNGFQKYKIKRGYGGGYSFTLEYLTFMRGTDQNLPVASEISRDRLIDEYMKQIETLVMIVRHLILQKGN